MSETEIQIASSDVKMNDTLIRVIGIPFFGIAIPNVSGLIRDLDYHTVEYWASYIYFITLAGLIWQGNRYLLFRTRQRFTWFERPIEKLVLLVLNNVFYTAPVTIAMLCLWYSWSFNAKPDWDVVKIVTLINTICVLFVTHVYETVFMVKEQQHEQIRNAELNRAKAEAELLALKNQVDPHFVFNSLNTLTYLIRKDSATALLFTENLAEVYRYILMQKDSSLVLLEDELEFTKKYSELLKLRFGNAFVVTKNFDGETERSFLIPPTSIFFALENAVKHNEMSVKHPLEIDISVEEKNLVVCNRMRERNNIVPSSKIGLRNLDERFRLLTGKGISTTKALEYFRISMPLVTLN